MNIIEKGDIGIKIKRVKGKNTCFLEIMLNKDDYAEFMNDIGNATVEDGETNRILEIGDDLGEFMDEIGIIVREKEWQK